MELRVKIELRVALLYEYNTKTGKNEDNPRLSYLLTPGYRKLRR